MDKTLPPPVHSGDGVWTQKLPTSALVLAPPREIEIPDEVWALIEHPPKLTSDTPFADELVGRAA